MHTRRARAQPEAPAARQERAATPRIDFCPCKADGSRFPRGAWLRSLRRVLIDASDADFAYVSRQGAPALRGALAEYLNRVRATSAVPDQIVICNGYAQGIKHRISHAGRPGLIFGYATLGEPTIAEGIATLADVIRASRGPAHSH